MSLDHSTARSAEGADRQIDDATVAVAVPFVHRTERLEELLWSARDAPVDRVVVADNSPPGVDVDPIVDQEYPFEVDVLDLPTDCGIGRCRHRLAAETDAEYLVVADSDMRIPDRIDVLISILERDHSLGAVSGVLEEHGTIRAGVCDLHEADLLGGETALVQSIREEKEVRWETGYPVARFDKLPNAMVVRRAAVEDYNWTPSLADKEHLDWFVGHWRTTDWEFGVCPTVLFRHYPTQTGEYYEQFRHGNEDRQERARSEFCRRWGYDRVVWGRTRWFGTERRPFPTRCYKAIEAELPTKYLLPVKDAVSRLTDA